MHTINENFKSLDRMTRPPVFNWTQENFDKSRERANPCDTSKVRIFAATWNMMGVMPR